jgi:hypothetical protein
MNKDIEMKDHMIEVFRAMLSALRTKNKRSVNIETVNRFVNPTHQHTVLDTAFVMSKLIDTGYIRYRDYLEKRYYNPSKLGTERWDAHLNGSLHEITREANKRIQDRESDSPPWERAQ